MNWLTGWIREGRDLQRRSEQTRREIAELLTRIAKDDLDRWLDLDRLTAIKWGDKTIDPTEVVYVLRSDR
jgi:hypothetical protein